MITGTYRTVKLTDYATYSWRRMIIYTTVKHTGMSTDIYCEDGWLFTEPQSNPCLSGDIDTIDWKGTEADGTPNSWLKREIAGAEPGAEKRKLRPDSDFQNYPRLWPSQCWDLVQVHRRGTTTQNEDGGGWSVFGRSARQDWLEIEFVQSPSSPEVERSTCRASANGLSRSLQVQVKKSRTPCRARVVIAIRVFTNFFLFPLRRQCGWEKFTV